ncbi:MAG: hypothetical protein K2H40_02915 [Lachnospiraceae bacterium]|nr:hypothetical protein [Lachnospiraceae bacterium]
MDTFMDKFAQRKKAQGMIDANAAADAANMEKLKRQVNEYELLLQEMRKVNLKTAENAGQMSKTIQAGIEKIEAFQADNAAHAGQEKILLEIREQLEKLLPEVQKQAEVQKRAEAVSEEAQKRAETLLVESRKCAETFLAEAQKQAEAVSEEAQKRAETLLERTRKQQETLSGELRIQLETLSKETKEQLEAFLPELKKQVGETSKQSEDFFHKESVKVYRNVQAAMTEELGKQTETLTALQKESGKKQKAVLPLTIVILLLLLADIAIHLSNFKLF